MGKAGISKLYTEAFWNDFKTWGVWWALKLSSTQIVECDLVAGFKISLLVTSLFYIL